MGRVVGVLEAHGLSHVLELVHLVDIELRKERFEGLFIVSVLVNDRNIDAVDDRVAE